MSMTNFIT